MRESSQRLHCAAAESDGGRVSRATVHVPRRLAHRQHPYAARRINGSEIAVGSGSPVRSELELSSWIAVLLCKQLLDCYCLLLLLLLQYL
jgi:hypothetical protein